MLRMTNFCGFGAAGDPNLKARLVNSYSYNFNSTAQATVTVPAVDLQYGGANRQILVLFDTSAVIPTSLTIDGVAAGLIASARFAQFYSAFYSGSGPFNIVVNITAASTELGSFAVWEVGNAAPLYEGYRGVDRQQNTQAGNLRVQPGNMVIAGAHHPTDTQAFTWTYPTEVLDLDAGSYRLSAAQDLTPQPARAALDVAWSAGAATYSEVSLALLPTSRTGIRGGFRFLSAVAGSGSTATFAAALENDLNNTGNGELIIAVLVEADVTISGVTFNGNAMTSRGSIVNTAATPDLVVHFFSISFTNGAAAGNIVVTASGSIAGINLGICEWVLYGVASYSALVSATGNSTGTTLAPSINDGGAVLVAGIKGVTTGSPAITGADEVGIFSLSTALIFVGNIVNEGAGAKSPQITFGAGDQFAFAALPVNP